MSGLIAVCTCVAHVLYLGSEFPIVILSLVRTMREDDFDPELVRGDLSWLHQHLGFVTIPHQICVGITRCKFGLIIVGESLNVCSHAIQYL